MEKCLSCFPVRCPVGESEEQGWQQGKAHWERGEGGVGKKQPPIIKVQITGKSSTVPRELQPGVGHFMLKL